MTAAVLLNTVLPRYLVELGATATEVGLLYSVTTMGSLVFRPITGTLVDRHGPLRVLLAGASLVAVCALALSRLGTPPSIIALMSGIGVSVGLVSTCCTTVVARSVAMNLRGETLAVYYLSMAVPIAAGPWLGLTLARTGGMNLVVVFVALLGLGIALLALCLPSTKGNGVAPSPRITWRLSVDQPALAAAVILCNAGFAPLYAFLPLYAREYGFDDVRWFFVLFATSVITCRVGFRRLSDRLGRLPVLLSFTSTLAIGFFGVALFPPTFVSLTICAVLLGVGFSVLQATLLALALDRTHPTRVGRTVGTMAAAFDMSGIVGGSLSGFVVERTTYGGAFVVAASLAVLGAAILILDGRRARQVSTASR